MTQQTPPERITPTPTIFTFSGGETLIIHRVSPILVRDFRKALARVLPEPVPPMQKVPRPDGTEGEEPNTSHPDYLKAVQTYFEEVGIRYLEFLTKHAVELEIDRVELAQFRADAEEDGVDLPKNDKVAWVTRRLIRSTEDMQQFQELVMSTMQPTERGIQTRIDQFRPKV